MDLFIQTERRLTAEMRREIQRKLDGEHPAGVPDRLKPALVDLHNALHDLDVLEGEIHQLQQKCEKIPGYVAQAEAHRNMLIESDKIIEFAKRQCDQLRDDLAAAQATISERDAVIAAMREEVTAIDHETDHLRIWNGQGWTYTPSQAVRIHIRTRRVLDDTTQLAADHDASVRADERKRVLEEAAQIASHAFMECDEDVQRIGERIAAQIRYVAGQPEEGKA